MIKLYAPSHDQLPSIEEGGWRAQILADSLSPHGVRLTSFLIRFPRIVLAEFNTHRVFSRNSASSRAIPVEKMLQMVMDDPFVPEYWGKNQKGMQAREELTDEMRQYAIEGWLDARDKAVSAARHLVRLDVHKQIANRLLEPFMWHTAIVTATEWGNYFALRAHEDAAPEIRVVAELMKNLYETWAPVRLDPNDWHLPLVYDADVNAVVERFQYLEAKPILVRISTGRTARTSYLTHDGKRVLDADLDLYSRLLYSRHMSPFEHPAFPHPAGPHRWGGNFRGWIQHRQQIPYESDASLIPA